MSEFEFDETTSTSSESSDKEEEQTKKDINKSHIYCNLYKCNYCHPNRPKLTKEEINEIKEKIKNKKQPRNLKTCNNRCDKCFHMALKINPYIEQEILEYSIKQKTKSEQNKKINDNSKYNTAKTNHISDTIQNKEKQNKTIEEYKLEENLDNFKKIEVNGDGNCLISSILTYLDIPLQYTKTLRNHIANAAEEYEWNNEILTSLNYQDNIDIAEKIKTPNTFIGYMEITPWLKKYNINLKLWLEDIRYQSSPWLSINQNNSEETEQYKIYLSFKQGTRADLDLEGHYNPIIPIIGVNKKLKDTIYNDLNTLKENTYKNKIYNNQQNQNDEKILSINILIWNVKSIGNFTKKKYLTQTLYTKDIHIALIQETMLKDEDKWFIKGYKIIDQMHQNIEKG